MFLSIIGRFISLVCGRHGNIIKCSPGNVARLQILYLTSRKQNTFLLQSTSSPSIRNKIPSIKAVSFQTVTFTVFMLLWYKVVLKQGTINLNVTHRV